MKKLKILFDYSPACQQKKTGIPVFVQRLYEELVHIDDIEIEKTCCISRYIPTMPRKIYRFFEQTLYHNIYLPLKLNWGKYDFYVESQYMFNPYLKTNETTIVIFVYDIGLVLFDGIQTEKFTRNWRKKLPLSIQNSDILVTISQSSVLDIRAYLSKIKQSNKLLEYIYADADLASDSSVAIDNRSCDINTPYFLFLGTLEPRKNPLVLVKAFLLYKSDTINDTKLVFAGRKGWLYEDVLEFVNSYGLENDVIFIGSVTSAEKIKLLKNASAFLFLSIYEGFGIPPLEAISMGVPTLVSDIPVFHELFENSVCYVNPHDKKAIARMMKKITDFPPTIDQKVINKFSWRLSALKLVSIFQKYKQEQKEG